MNNDYITRICEQIASIMFKYPSIFPIVGVLKSEGAKYNLDQRFYVGEYLMNRVALSFVVNTKFKIMEELQWSCKDHNLMDDLEKELIKSCLLVYTKRFPDRDEVNEYNEMLKKEKLQNG